MSLILPIRNVQVEMTALAARRLRILLYMQFYACLLVAQEDRPIISHVDIMEQKVDFSRLGSDAYRSTLPFGDRLLNAFDTVLPFSKCPDRLDLPHDLNTLTLHFSFTEWQSPHKVLYAHFLEGRDREWSVPSEDPFVILRDLPHGAYTLLIKARGGSTHWSSPTAFSFEIRKAWWLSTWAIGAMTVIIFALVIMLMRYWAQRRSEIKEMQQLIEAYKNASLSPLRLSGQSDHVDGFLRLVNHTLETHLSDENFGIAELCELLNISRAQLHRKLKKSTGLSTSHYIRTLRLRMARAMLLGDPGLNVSEVAFAVGFSNAAYFSRVFKSQYGVSPSEARIQA